MFLDFAAQAFPGRLGVYPDRMQKASQHQCEIIYVKTRSGTGWKWRVVSAAGVAQSSEQAYELFYECVVAARESGYTPAGVLPEGYRRASSRAA